MICNFWFNVFCWKAICSSNSSWYFWPSSFTSNLLSDAEYWLLQTERVALDSGVEGLLIIGLLVVQLPQKFVSQIVYEIYLVRMTVVKK